MRAGNGTNWPSEKVAEVKALLLEGVSSSETSRRTGVPQKTIQDWLRKPDFKALIEQHRASISQMAGDMLMARLEAVAEGSEQMSLTAIATVWGIAQDKIINSQRFSMPESNAVFYQLVQSQTVNMIGEPKKMIEGELASPEV